MVYLGGARWGSNAAACVGGIWAVLGVREPAADRMGASGAADSGRLHYDAASCTMREGCSERACSGEAPTTTSLSSVV